MNEFEILEKLRLFFRNGYFTTLRNRSLLPMYPKLNSEFTLELAKLNKKFKSRALYPESVEFYNRVAGCFNGLPLEQRKVLFYRYFMDKGLYTIRVGKACKRKNMPIMSYLIFKEIYKMSGIRKNDLINKALMNFSWIIDEVGNQIKGGIDYV